MGKGKGKGGCGTTSVWEELDLYEQVIIVISILIGIGLIIAGIVLIATKADSSRNILVGNYTDAITKFQSTDSQFSQTKFAFGAETLTKNSNADILNDIGTFPSYTPVKYQITVSTAVAASGIILTSDKPTNQSFSLPGLPVSDSFSASQAFLNCRTPTIPCSGTMIDDCNQKPFCSEYCRQMNGNWDDTNLVCTGTHYLSDICVRIDDSTGTWSVGIGCYFRGHDSPTSLGNVDPQIFFYSPAIYTPFQKNTTVVTLRYVTDPYITASEVTFGTYNFGKTLVQSITNGIIVLAVGVGYTILDIIAVILFIWWTQTAGRGRKGKIRNGGLESREASRGTGQVDLENLIPPNAGKKPAPGHETYEHDIKPITHIIPIYPLDQTPTRTESSPGSN